MKQMTVNDLQTLMTSPLLTMFEFSLEPGRYQEEIEEVLTRPVTDDELTDIIHVLKVWRRLQPRRMVDIRWNVEIP